MSQISPNDLITVKQAAQEVTKDIFRSKDVAEYCDYSTQEVALRLKKLEEQDIVTKMNNGTPHTWTITK